MLNDGGRNWSKIFSPERCIQFRCWEICGFFRGEILAQRNAHMTLLRSLYLTINRHSLKDTKPTHRQINWTDTHNQSSTAENPFCHFAIWWRPNGISITCFQDERAEQYRRVAWKIDFYRFPYLKKTRKRRRKKLSITFVYRHFFVGIYGNIIIIALPIRLCPSREIEITFVLLRASWA